MDPKKSVSGDNQCLSVKFVRDELDGVRRARRPGPDGKSPVVVPPHEVDEEIVRLVLAFFNSRGEFIRTRYATLFFDRIDKKIFNVREGDPELARILRDLNLQYRQKHTTMVIGTLVEYASLAPIRDLPKISFMTPEAVYINAGPSRMWKVTEDAIEPVALGHDGVILLDASIGEWPADEALLPLIEEMRPSVGRACCQLLPDLPLTQHLTTRWGLNYDLTPEQMHEFFIERLLFMYSAASVTDLWAYLVLTGEEGGGKSTGLSLPLSFVRGKLCPGRSMPPTKEDLALAAATSSILALDNIDDTNLASPKNAGMSNIFCNMATGGTDERRRLHTPNTIDEYPLQTHLYATSRANPFVRPDEIRRTIQLEVEPVGNHRLADKRMLFESMFAERPLILVEVLLRTQNIVKAYKSSRTLDMDQLAERYGRRSGMPEYEMFSYRCAEYEGTLKAAQDRWSAQADSDKKTLSETSPLVHALQIYIGKVAKEVPRISARELHSGMLTAFHEVGQTLIYTAANKLGEHFRNHGKAVALIGVTQGRDRNGRYISIKPSQAEITRCVHLYGTLKKDAEARDRYRIVLPNAQPRDWAAEAKAAAALDNTDDLP